MYAPSEKIRNPNNLRCHSEQENKGHKQDSQKIWYGHVDEEDHLRFNNRNFNGNFNNKYIYNKSCRCRNTDHWTTLGTNSQSVEVSIVIKT
jgi:hypothetical protein